MKTFKGKAIYNPSGKAGEYSYWACNFYVGCSNGCTYCYCKKGILSRSLGGDTPKLKACFKDKNHAIEVFEKELKANLPELKKHGLFFTFTSDPCLPETILLTEEALGVCRYRSIPVKILTKRSDWVDLYIEDLGRYKLQCGATGERYKLPKIAFGFTLTGHDELEPNASTNAERIEAMRKLHDEGFKTWASIEPVIDIPHSLAMINLSSGHCDLYKVGLMSGKKYSKLELQVFIEMVNRMYPKNKFYFKDSLLKQAGISRSELPNNCVGRDYNMFND